MVSIATGSPLIRIMVKSIAGVAWGPVHASVYTSEVNSLHWNSPAIYLKKIETHCNREDCRDKLEETDRDEGGKHWDRWGRGRVIQRGDSLWLKTAPQVLLLKASTRAAEDQQARDLNPIHKRDPAAELSCCCHISLPLCSDSSVPPLSLDPSVSLGNELSSRAAVVCLLREFPAGRRERWGESTSKLISWKHGFRLPFQHITVTAYELWHCPEDS